MKTTKVNPFVKTNDYIDGKPCFFDAREIVGIKLYDFDDDEPLAYEIMLKSGQSMVVADHTYKVDDREMNLWDYVDCVIGCGKYSEMIEFFK